MIEIIDFLLGLAIFEIAKDLNPFRNLPYLSREGIIIFVTIGICIVSYFSIEGKLKSKQDKFSLNIVTIAMVIGFVVFIREMGYRIYKEEILASCGLYSIEQEQQEKIFGDSGHPFRFIMPSWDADNGNPCGVVTWTTLNRETHPIKLSNAYSNLINRYEPKIDNFIKGVARTIKNVGIAIGVLILIIGFVFVAKVIWQALPEILERQEKVSKQIEKVDRVQDYERSYGMNIRSLLISCVVAGGAMGIFANLPIISWINILCGVWYWIGAIFVVWYYIRLEGGKISMTGGQGAVLGFISIVIGMVVSAIIALVIAGIFGITHEYLEKLPDAFAGIFAAGLGQALGPSCIFAPFAGPVGGWIGVQLFANQKN